MGSTLVKPLADAQKNLQKDLQEEMTRRQRQTMQETQERMRRVTMAQQKAMAKDRFYYLCGMCGLILISLSGTAFALRHPQSFMARNMKRIPGFLLPGMGMVGTWTVWHWDMVYGNKLARINKWTEEYLETADEWHRPVVATPTSPNDVDKK